MLANLIIIISSFFFFFTINENFSKAFLTYGIKLKYIALVHNVLHGLQYKLRRSYCEHKILTGVLYLHFSKCDTEFRIIRCNFFPGIVALLPLENMYCGLTPTRQNAKHSMQCPP